MNFLRMIFSRMGLLVILILALILFQWIGGKSTGTLKIDLEKIKNQESVTKKLYRELQSLHQRRNTLAVWEIQEKAVLEAKISATSAAYETAYQSLRTMRRAKHEVKEEGVNAWRTYGTRSIILAIVILILLPILQKILMYWGIAKLIERMPPVKGNIPEIPTGKLRIHKAEAALEIPLKDGDKLLLRASDWGKKRSGVTAKTRWMWSWRYPLVSFAADLCELLEFSPKKKDSSASVDITSPTPDIFIARVDLNGGGLVLRPKHLVGMIGDVHIRTRWHFRIHNLLSGRIRQVELFGKGSLFVAGMWGLTATHPDTAQDSRIEDGLLVGYEIGSEYSLCRTETFWHYCRGQATLFDRKLTKGIFLTQNNRWDFRKAQESFFERTINTLLNGIGSLIGF